MTATAASYSYIDSDFTDANETLREYRKRTNEPRQPLLRRAYRRLVPAL
jgi:hypothetical protein